MAEKEKQAEATEAKPEAKTQSKTSTKRSGPPSPEEIAAAEQTLAAPNAKYDDIVAAKEVLARGTGPRSQARQGMQTTETQPSAQTLVSPAGAEGTRAQVQATDEVATQRVPGAPSQGSEPQKGTETKK